jgi:Putative transposase of IS4/5 family (DUF4096)
MGCCELSDREWDPIKPHLPNKPRGVPCVDDRRVLNGVFWVLRSEAPLADLREHYGLQPLQSLAKGRCLGSADGPRCRGPRRRGSEDRHLHRACPTARRDGRKGGPDRCLGRSRGRAHDQNPHARRQEWAADLRRNFCYDDLLSEIEAGTEIAAACACSLPISPATSRPRSSGVFPTALTASGIAAAMRAAAAATAGDVTVMDRDDKLSAASATRTPASVSAA